MDNYVFNQAELPSGLFDREGTDLMSSLWGSLSDGILGQEFQLCDPLSLETSVGFTGLELILRFHIRTCCSLELLQV